MPVYLVHQCNRFYVTELGGTKDLPFFKYNALEWEWQIFGVP